MILQNNFPLIAYLYDSSPFVSLYSSHLLFILFINYLFSFLIYFLEIYGYYCLSTGGSQVAYLIILPADFDYSNVFPFIP